MSFFINLWHKFLSLKRWKKIGLVIGILLMAGYLYSLPEPLFDSPYSTLVSDRNGELFRARIASDGQWRFPQADSVPWKYETCLLTFEDKYFRYQASDVSYVYIPAVFETAGASFQVITTSEIETEIIRSIISNALNKCFSHIEFVIRENLKENQLKDLIEIPLQYPFIHFTIYNSSIKKNESHIKYKNIDFLARDIDFCKDCGVIAQENFIIPTISSYMENRLYNGCLNRKVSIDQDGNIKNCPSFKFSYGNISNVKIKDVVSTKRFQEIWTINKDKIEICKECEFKPICTDCRAYILDPNNIYSKPKKCTYDPSTSTWK